MLRRLAVLVMLASLPAARCEAASRFATPSAELVESLYRQLHRNDWLVIATDSARYEARVVRIGAHGLDGLSPFRSSTVVPETIAWSEVSSLDLRRSKLLKWQIVGFAAGFALGLEELHFTGSAFGGARAIGAMTLGAAAGTLTGNWVGAHRYYQRRIFEGWPEDDHPAIAASGGASEPLAQVESPSLGRVAPADSAHIAGVLWRLHPRQRLRLHGDFDSFEGYVAYAGQEKLEGMISTRSFDPKSRSLHELEWDRISKVETLGNGSLRGALIGGAALGGLGLLIGMPVGAVAEPGNNYAFAAGGLIGFSILGSVGAVIGGLAGSGAPAWHPVYRRK